MEQCRRAMWRRARGSMGGLALLAAACSAEEPPGQPGGFGTGVTSGPPPQSTEAQPTDAAPAGSGSGMSNDATSSTAASSITTDDPFIFDLIQPDPPPSGGCNKVDFVFAVDNSCSTDDDQLTLQQTFPEFIQLIRDNVQGQDYHIMVVDSDGDPTWACEHGGPSCCLNFVEGSHAFDTCDLELGAGVREPHGGSASNMDCGVPDDRRYLTGDDPDLEDTFACVAQVGTSGSFAERPVEAAVRALENPLGCNDGFLRDDAILVMTVITDDHDNDGVHPGDAEMGDADDWYRRIVAAKNGNAEASVFIGLTSLACSGPPAQPFQDIVSLFGVRGVQGSHCSQQEMLDSFELAVTTISTTCDEFEPAS